MNNKENFDSAMEAFGPAIARIAASFEADPHLREDLIQEIGLAVWSSLDNFRATGSLKGFVLRVAHNKAVDHVAKEAVRNKRTEVLGDDIGGTQTFETSVQLSQQQVRLMAAIRQMSLPLKEVTTLLLEDMSYREIASILGISVANVGVRVIRAKAHLREVLT